MDLRSSGGGSGIPRHHHYDRIVLAVQQTNFPHRGGGAADPGGLFDERHHRGVRSHSRKFEAGAARVANQYHQPERESDLEPDHHVERSDLLDRHGAILVRRPGFEQLLFCSGSGNFSGNVLLDFYCESNPGILAELPRFARIEGPGAAGQAGKRSSGADGGESQGSARISDKQRRGKERILWQCLIKPSWKERLKKAGRWWSRSPCSFCCWSS